MLSLLKNRRASDIERFLLVGAANTAVTFLLYQILLFWIDARVAYAITWVVGIVAVAVFYPTAFRVPHASAGKRAMIVLVYFTSFALGLTLVAGGRSLGLDRFAIIAALAVTIPYNFLLMKLVLRGNNRFSGPPVSTTLSHQTLIASIAVIAVVNVAVFWRHYLGLATFPWDFLGGYHAHSYAWYALGGVTNPPLWYPWADGGFPAFFALQSGAWYLPLEVMRLLGIPYDIVNATRLQCLHVLLGAVGVLLLARLFRLDWRAALVSALCYQFSASFFSNQQHVDIVRGAAWVPWVLVVTNPRFISSSRYAPLVTAIALFQFLICSYPGIIVSTTYAAVLAWLITLFHDRNSLLGAVTYKSVVAALAAILMSGLKFAPLFQFGDRVSDRATDFALIDNPLWATLFMPYDKSFLPSDVTMRSLWLPAVATVALFYLRRFTLAVQIGLLLIFMAVLFGAHPLPSAIDLWLPGMNISRFPISDWRPLLHLGIIILSCSVLDEFLDDAAESKPASTSWLMRTACGFTLVPLVAYFAWGMGYSTGEIVRMILVVGVSLAAYAYLAVSAGSLKQKASVIWILCVLAIIDGISFHLTQPRPWNINWTAEVEQQVFGQHPDFAVRQEQRIYVRRGPRYTLRTKLDDALLTSQNGLYNACWYNLTFCAFGYNNLKMSVPHVERNKLLADPKDGPGIFAYLTKPQQLVILSEAQDFDASVVPVENVEPVVSMVSGVDAAIQSYSADEVHYRIRTPLPITVIENEMWATGWTMTRCNRVGACSSEPPEHTRSYFRSWKLPAGDWLVTLSYGPGLYNLAYTMFFAGLVLAALTALGSGGRCRTSEPAPQ